MLSILRLFYAYRCLPVRPARIRVARSVGRLMAGVVQLEGLET